MDQQSDTKDDEKDNGSSKASEQRVEDSDKSPNESFSTDALVESLLEAEKDLTGVSVLKSLDLAGVADLIKSGTCTNVIVMCGAGISTAAGIPDFRSPGSGLYDNLAQYDLPHPQAIFELGYFMQSPKPFFVLAKQLYPVQLRPTLSHYLIRLLADQGILLRVFTQNVDTLEHVAGVPEEKIVEAHGSFRHGHCMNRSCAKEFSQDWVKQRVMVDEVPRCPLCDTVVKPDIIFFGESLPDQFFEAVKDFSECDLLIVMGTSLLVQPFASLINRVGASVPRLLINREKVGHDELLSLMSYTSGGGGFNFDSPDNKRDVFSEGDCDAGCAKLADLCGWKTVLEDLVESEKKKLEVKDEEKVGSCCGAGGSANL